MTCRERERIAGQINEVRGRLEELMMNKGMVTDDEVVILSQNLDELIIQYYREDETDKGEQ